MERIDFVVLFYHVLALMFPNGIQAVATGLPLIRVSGGLLEGVKSSDSSYIAYYGIPYATVTERFRDSVPDPKWDGIKKANVTNIECAQRVNETSIQGIEDCLVLNVYVPSLPSKTPRSVMVYIHGGGYYKGSNSPSLLGPDHLLKHDVILVTINYRVDKLGFLCLRTKEAPGNVGLKDQVKALKWINKNINAFGGNPDSVTIFGQSAGASAVTYHLLSPLSQGLFNKVIVESGTATSFAFFQHDPIFLAHRFAAQLELDTDNLQDLVKNLNTRSIQNLLVTRVPRKIGDQYETENKFLPCVEKDIPGIERFLPDYPYKLITSGKYHKVPMIIGFTNEEGYGLAGKENDTTIRNLNFFDALPRDLDFPSIKTKQQTAQDIKTLYLPNEPISRKTLVKFSRYAGESSLIFPVVNTIEIVLATNNESVYTYKFTHNGTLNILKLELGFGKYPGAGHSDELYYLFSNKYIPADLPQRDVDIINKLATLWSNFAKFSNPTPEVTDILPLQWRPADRNNTQVYVIDNNLSTAPLWNERLLFWKTVYSKYRRAGNTEDLENKY